MSIQGKKVMITRSQNVFIMSYLSSTLYNCQFKRCTKLAHLSFFEVSVFICGK